MNYEQTLITFITTCATGVGAYVLVMEKRRAKERKEAEDERKRIEERHQRERSELMEINQVMFDKLGDIAKDGQRTADEGHKVIREFSNLLTGLKTLLENQRRNER